MESQTQVKYTCLFCEKDFCREQSLVVHVCEQKKRFQERDERGVQLGLQAYLRFYEITQGSARLKSWEDFTKSAYYRAFVKFGRYCVDARVISPGRFMDWLIKNNKKIDHWCRDSLYDEYLTAYVRMEAAEDALARALEAALTWSEQTGYPSADYLRHGNDNAICHAITKGSVTAWILYNCDSGHEFLDRITSEQIAMIWPYIDSESWQRRFRDYPSDQEYLKQMLQKAGW